MFRGGKEVVVEVEFDSYQARYARERSFHPTQSREELDGGRLRLKFETSEAALEQVARWLMQYGEHAVAVGPAELREMMRERLHRAAELYKSINDEVSNDSSNHKL
jgi:predicted DNA-binding transcriptional regulator YafY